VLWRGDIGSFESAGGHGADSEDRGGDTAGVAQLHEGGSVFQFEWALPKRLPRSFTDASQLLEQHSIITPLGGMAQSALARAGYWFDQERSHIRYTAELVVEGPDVPPAADGDGDASLLSAASLPRCMRVLHVIEHYSPRSSETIPHTSPPLPFNQAIERTEARTYMFGGEQPCAVSVMLRRPVVVPGRSHKVEVNIINGSTRTVVGFTARIVRTVKLKFSAKAGSEDILGLTSEERVATKDDVVFEANNITMVETGTGDEVTRVAPMDSKFCSFVLKVPGSVEGSVSRGKKLIVAHSLHIELKVRASSSLITKVPVYVIDSIMPPEDGSADEMMGASAASWFLSEAGSTMLRLAHAAEERKQRAAALLPWVKKDGAEEGEETKSAGNTVGATADVDGAENGEKESK